MGCLEICSFRNSFRKIFLSSSLWMMSSCTQGTVQTFMWLFEPIILSIGHFKGPAEVQVSSWWKTFSLWSIIVWYCRLILLKGRWNFLRYLIWRFINFGKIFCERVLSWYTWYSGNSWDCQMALQTDHFVDRTFPESNWTVGKRMLASDQSQFGYAGWFYLKHN